MLRPSPSALLTLLPTLLAATTIPSAGAVGGAAQRLSTDVIPTAQAIELRIDPALDLKRIPEERGPASEVKRKE